MIDGYVDPEDLEKELLDITGEFSPPDGAAAVWPERHAAVPDNRTGQSCSPQRYPQGDVEDVQSVTCSMIATALLEIRDAPTRPVSCAHPCRSVLGEHLAFGEIEVKLVQRLGNRAHSVGQVLHGDEGDRRRFRETRESW